MVSEEHRVVDITEIKELEIITKKYPSNLIIIDFSAIWCGPCNSIKPIYEALSKEYTNCVFLKIDVDKGTELSDFFDIQSLPTFLLMKDSKAFHKWTGVNDDIKEKIDKYIDFDVSALNENKEEDKEEDKEERN